MALWLCLISTWISLGYTGAYDGKEMEDSWGYTTLGIRGFFARSFLMILVLLWSEIEDMEPRRSCLQACKKSYFEFPELVGKNLRVPEFLSFCKWGLSLSFYCDSPRLLWSGRDRLWYIYFVVIFSAMPMVHFIHWVNILNSNS